MGTHHAAYCTIINTVLFMIMTVVVFFIIGSHVTIKVHEIENYVQQVTATPNAGLSTRNVNETPETSENSSTTCGSPRQTLDRPSTRSTKSQGRGNRKSRERFSESQRVESGHPQHIDSLVSSSASALERGRLQLHSYPTPSTFPRHSTLTGRSNNRQSLSTWSACERCSCN